MTNITEFPNDRPAETIVSPLFSEHIKTVCTGIQINARNLADKLDLPYDTVRKVVKGIIYIGPDVMVKFCEGLGLDKREMDNLVNWDRIMFLHNTQVKSEISDKYETIFETVRKNAEERRNKLFARSEADIIH